MNTQNRLKELIDLIPVEDQPSLMATAKETYLLHKRLESYGEYRDKSESRQNKLIGIVKAHLLDRYPHIDQDILFEFMQVSFWVQKESEPVYQFLTN